LRTGPLHNSDMTQPQSPVMEHKGLSVAYSLSLT
jgi:hypothetical protein